MRKRYLAAAAASAIAVSIAMPNPASAHTTTSPSVTTLASTVGPAFNLDFSHRGLLVADGAGQVSRVNRDGSLTTVVPDVVGASGVATSRHLLAYTSTTTNEETFENTAASLEITGRSGFHVHADTLAYEKAHNPDSVNTYGIANPTPCQSDALGPMANYTGAIDSHAYSVASWGNNWVLADAGANDLLKIDNRGRIRTLAVLPPQPAVITAAAAAANGFPDCVVGATYNFEPVPTDVEVGHDGMLYVTTLPGGPEDPSLGARGAVYKVNPRNGRVRLVASGLAGATNLAIGQDGRIFVTELFAGRISEVRRGSVRPLVDLAGAVSVETGNRGTLYAGTIDFAGGPGTVVRIDLGKHHRGH